MAAATGAFNFTDPNAPANGSATGTTYTNTAPTAGQASNPFPSTGAAPTSPLPGGGLPAGTFTPAPGSNPITPGTNNTMASLPAPGVSAFAAPPANQDLNTTITNGFQAAYGKTPSAADTAYWTQKWPELVARGQQIGDPNYAWNRLIGMGAGGADAAKYGPYAGGDGSGGTGSSGSSTLDSSGGTPFSPTARDPQWDAFYQQLSQRANQSLAVSPNDPVMKAQTDAYSAAQTRASRNNLSAVAEAAGPNANLTAETRAAGETAGQNTANYQGGLMTQEINARRAEIAQALTGMGGMLTAEETSRLHEEDLALQQAAQNATNTQNAWQDNYTSNFG
jgi:hypothetical protein